MLIKGAAFAALLVLTAVGFAHAQAPTGTITGIATDPSGSALPGVQITVVHRDTGQVRTVATSEAGHYSVAALLPGIYQIKAEVPRFRDVRRLATVEAGTATTMDLRFELSGAVEQLTVRAVEPHLHYHHHQVTGLISRKQIEALPLNGRDFIELAKLEPGFTNPSRLTDSRVFVSALGGGLQTIPRIGNTRVTIDGVNASTPGTVGVTLQLSQEVVQEFQLSTVNFDSATGLTTSGAINIVTRSGGNDFRGGGFYLYRDDTMAAYPALRRDARNPDPFFQRRQWGSFAGGPIRKDRGFFFASYERNDQRGVVSVQPGTPAFAPLGGVFPTPQVVNQASGRVDARPHRNHTVFGRYTFSDTATSAGTPNVLPSGWPRRFSRVDQGLVTLTSVLSGQLVNDLRVSYSGSDQTLRPPTAEECRGCFGLGELRITIPDAGLIFGNPGRTVGVGRRYQVTESLVWQKGRHMVRFGSEWEHSTVSLTNINQEPAEITLWSPGRSRQSDSGIQVPVSFTSVDDILQLPLRSFETAVGPGSPPWQGFRRLRSLDLFRLFASDTWRVGPRFTVNYGLGWSLEPNALNHDLTKPALLAPVLGARGLDAPAVHYGLFSPTLGLVWTATRDGKTVVRVGGGRYFDPVASSHVLHVINERHLLSPLGTGRLTQSGANILFNSRPLSFPQPTPFTGAQLLSLLPGIRAELLQSLDPDNQNFSLRNLNRTKEGQNLYDPSYTTPSALHVNLGIQRQLPRGFVLAADLVWKRFLHTFINGVDYNRWDSVGGPVIPVCSETERHDLAATCSNGPLYFDTTIGRARYVGLLARLEKRFSGRAQLLASYALGSFVGTNGTGTGTSENPGGRVFGFNNDDWFENYGALPSDLRHLLDVSGFVVLRWQIQVGVNLSAHSRPPFAPYVAGVDFNGDGTRDDLLPGTRVNQFGRGLDGAALRRLVDRYNQQFAGQPTVRGQIAPLIILPDEVEFGDTFFTLDLRLSRSVVVSRQRITLTAFGEVFNLLNVANLTGYGSNLVNSTTFGQPSARFTQIFGSGGPRAFQVGARVGF